MPRRQAPIDTCDNGIHSLGEQQVSCPQHGEKGVEHKGTCGVANDIGQVFQDCTRSGCSYRFKLDG